MDNWNGNKKKEADPVGETATKSKPKPGDYPVGSFKSRAAARATLHPMHTAEEERNIAVCQTLSNEELDALIAYFQDGNKHSPTPEQEAALVILQERHEELRTTGNLTAKPWGWSK